MTSSYERFSVVMPKDAAHLWHLAYGQIEQECRLPESAPFAKGRVIELLCADYLAGLHGFVTVPEEKQVARFPGNWKM